MSDKDYVIQVEEVQSSVDARKGEGVAAAAAASAKGSSSRRTSTSSQQSLPSCVSPNYDSGNFSGSNTSEAGIPPLGDSSTEDESSDYLLELGLTELTDDVKQLQRDLQEKNQMLLLAVADARKMRSELERLMKSEQWYKNEFKNQKRSRLELLEKLYMNERKFVEENQKLKADCANLYSVCSDLEKKALTEKDTLVKQLKELQRLFESTKVADENSVAQSVIDQLKFELQKQREFVQEKDSLVGVLKKQKRGLLKDLDTLSAERDSKILNLEASAFTLEQENRQITRRCAVLVEEKRKLEDDLRQLQTFLENTKAVLHQRQLEILKLKELNQEQLKEQEGRIAEIENLKERMRELEKENMQEGCNNFKNLKLLDSYKLEIEKKTEELEQVKSLRRADNERISKLQIEVLGLEGIQESYECAEREKEQLNFQLQSKDVEIQNLHMFQENQLAQIVGLQEKLSEYQRLKENFDKYVSLLQANNETLEARELEIENLKSIHEQLQKELAESAKSREQQTENLQIKDNQLQEKDEEVAALRLIVAQQAIVIQELNKEIEWALQMKQSLAECQKQLELEKNSSALKEREIQKLTQAIGKHTQKLKEFEGANEENCKLQKDLENLNLELERCSSELLGLREINAKQALEIEDLSSFKDQEHHLQKILKERTSALQERDYEVETLRLVVKGQKAQVKRFNCKCAENKELRKKFEEASNLLLVDRKIFETEAAELDFLRNLVERQALEIGKHLDEKDDPPSSIVSGSDEVDRMLGQQLFEIDDSFSTMETDGRFDLEEKAHKIGLMKAILDKKCDKISQLNCEADQWIELLKNLRISKSRSRDGSSERVSENCSDAKKQDEDEDEKSDAENDKHLASQARNCSTTDIEGNIEEVCVKSTNPEDELPIKNGNVHTTTEEIEGNVDASELPEKKPPVELDQNISLRNDSEHENQTTKSNLAHIRSAPVSLEQNKPFITLVTQSLGDEFAKQVVICPPIAKNNFKLKSSQTGENVEAECREKTSDFTDNTKNCKDCEVLRKVLETEQRKKISRYEAHMHTLLKNMKSYKRKLGLMENKYDELMEKYQIMELKLSDLEGENEMLRMSYKEEMENIMSAKVRDMRRNRDKNSREKSLSPHQIEEIHRKYKQSQRVIAVLKSQLETARKQFLEVDECKRVSLELKFNLDNFVENYKKLISPLDSYKSSIASDEIYDLINRSNSLVPNFDNLSNSIDALKNDIKKAALCGVSRSSPVRKLSLLDELRAADPLRFS